MKKEFFKNTITSSHMQKFEALLKGPLFLGDKVVLPAQALALKNIPIR